MALLLSEMILLFSSHPCQPDLDLHVCDINLSIGTCFQVWWTHGGLWRLGEKVLFLSWCSVSGAVEASCHANRTGNLVESWIGDKFRWWSPQKMFCIRAC